MSGFIEKNVSPPSLPFFLFPLKRAIKKSRNGA